MSDIKVSSNYAGGNVNVISIGDNEIVIEQEIRDTSRWWFYWNFCVENAKNKEIMFRFANGEVVSKFGPAVSRDKVNWERSGTFIDHCSFKYKFDTDEKVYFAFSVPYQIKDYIRFTDKNKDKITAKTLIHSEKNREVPLILIGRAKAKKNILFTCRHHACESMAGYQLEGIMQYIIDNPAEFLDYLVSVVPFVDVDGVEEGDQGKARNPHDHNRDYAENSIYNSVKAIKEYAGNKDIEIFMDFHCPSKWAPSNEFPYKRSDYPYIVKTVSPIKEEQEKFSGLLEKSTAKDLLKFNSIYNLEHGEGWNVDPGDGLLSSAGYFRNKGVKLCLTFEMPYAGVEDNFVTAGSCYRFGYSFGKALSDYING